MDRLRLIASDKWVAGALIERERGPSASEGAYGSIPPVHATALAIDITRGASFEVIWTDSRGNQVPQPFVESVIPFGGDSCLIVTACDPRMDASFLHVTLWEWNLTSHQVMARGCFPRCENLLAATNGSDLSVCFDSPPSTAGVSVRLQSRRTGQATALALNYEGESDGGMFALVDWHGQWFAGGAQTGSVVEFDWGHEARARRDVRCLDPTGQKGIRWRRSDRDLSDSLNAEEVLLLAPVPNARRPLRHIPCVACVATRDGMQYQIILLDSETGIARKVALLPDIPIRMPIVIGVGEAVAYKESKPKGDAEITLISLGDGATKAIHAEGLGSFDLFDSTADGRLVLSRSDALLILDARTKVKETMYFGISP